jgi:hypothetical protein
LVRRNQSINTSRPGGFQFGQHCLIAGYSFRKTGNPLIQGSTEFTDQRQQISHLFSGGCYFLAVYRWSKAIEYFLRIVLLNTFFAALNILRCNLLNISDVVLNI